jgi:hemolysin III
LFPTYTSAERAADAAVHLAGVLFGVAGAFALIFAAAGRVPVRDVAGLGVYSVGLIGMFTASASYNLIDRPTRREWLRRIDHAVIFVMIAGSYTPFALKIGGETGLWLLCAVWAIAIFGVVAKLAFPRKLDRISLVLYLAQGWCILFAIGPLVEAIPSSSTNLLLIGGLIYTAGVIFHLLERLPYHNVIWHVFVLGGAIAQYASIYGAVIAAPL